MATKTSYSTVARHMRHMLERVLTYNDTFDETTFRQTVVELGNAFMEDNHRFNRAKFERDIYGDKT